MGALDKNTHSVYLYLIPNYIGSERWEGNFPEENRRIICSLKYFIAEDIKACKKLLKDAGYEDVSSAQIEEYNEHHFYKDIDHLLHPFNEGYSVGLVSEAGCPVIADPGDELVRTAHFRNIRVVPLVGPNAIILAIMAAGLSGNAFTFHGYLPIEGHEKVRRIKEIEQFSYHKRQSQFFIEAPYRNQKIFSLLLQILHPDTLLSIACDIQHTNPVILTKRVYEWKKNPLPDIHKKPCIFGLLKV